MGIALGRGRGARLSARSGLKAARPQARSTTRTTRPPTPHSPSRPLRLRPRRTHACWRRRALPARTIASRRRAARRLSADRIATPCRSFPSRKKRRRHLRSSAPRQDPHRRAGSNAQTLPRPRPAEGAPADATLPHPPGSRTRRAGHPPRPGNRCAAQAARLFGGAVTLPKPGWLGRAARRYDPKRRSSADGHGRRRAGTALRKASRPTLAGRRPYPRWRADRRSALPRG